MRKGVSFKKLSNADSYLAHYYTQKDVLFNQYGPSVALVFDEPNNYSDPAVSPKAVFKLVLHLRVHSQQVKLNAKAKFFIDLCRYSMWTVNYIS